MPAAVWSVKRRDMTYEFVVKSIEEESKKMNGSNWGEIIEKTLNQGREDRSTKFKKIKPTDFKYDSFAHASNVMIYAKTNALGVDLFPVKAFLLMQMRCDGYIGFPGGFVNLGETPLEAVNRKVKEELGWTEAQDVISEADHQFTHLDEEKEIVMHFYTTEITESKMLEIEQNILKAPNYGKEVLGHFRVPLYIMGDAFRGFPSFLRNHFCGNSKLQLIEAVVNLKFFTEEQVVQALYSAPLITF